MKKKALLLASIGALACTVGITAIAVGGGPKLNAVFETKAASKNFTFNAATGSQFESMPDPQDVNVTTGVSDPIHTTVAPESMELTFGEGERFVGAEPMLGECGYSLMIGINNLTHFAIDMGVENDVDKGDEYSITLLDDDRNQVGHWNSSFKLDGDGNGTAHLEWDKEEEGYDGTVVEVNVSLYSMEDSPDANLYIKSMSLYWNC